MVKVCYEDTLNNSGFFTIGLPFDFWVTFEYELTFETNVLEGEEVNVPVMEPLLCSLCPYARLYIPKEE